MHVEIIRLSFYYIAWNITYFAYKENMGSRPIQKQYISKHTYSPCLLFTLLSVVIE